MKSCEGRIVTLLRRCSWIGATVSVLAAFAGTALPAPPTAEELPVTRTEDVIYGRKFGVALTMDVFTPHPDKANGKGILFCISAGWESAKSDIPVFLFFMKEFLDRGYVVFAVVHGSQPRFTIPEIVEDMHRAVRFVRANAKKYHVDPEKLGITGGSAGGHLALMMATDISPGDSKAADPVNRQPSRVAAVACLYPPTDFLNYGRDGTEAIGNVIPPEYRAPFDFTEFDPRSKTFVKVTDAAMCREICRRISPAYHVTKDSAPAFIVHGDADDIVPLQQSERIIAKYKEAGAPCELVVVKGAGHGFWLGIGRDIKKMGDWFDKYLLK